MIVLTPVRIFSLAYPAVAVLVGMALLCGAWALALAAWRRREGAGLLLAGVAVFALAVFNDLLYYAGVLCSTDLAPMGLFVLLLFQASVIAQRAAHAFARQEALSEENAGLLATVRQQLDELQRSRRLIAAAEDAQRKRIAELLHGRVQTRLFLAWKRLQECQALLQDDRDEALAVLGQVAQELDEVREQDVREVSHLLHPSIVEVGLVPALRSLARRFRGSIRVELSVEPEVAVLDNPGDARIPEPVRFAAYRVLKESLSNSYRHGGASKAEVSLALEGGSLRMVARDDGRGFDPGGARAGLGLRLMADRVAQVGGEWEVQSAPGTGTTVVFRFPLSGQGGQAAG